jgi:hypothetical protein
MIALTTVLLFVSAPAIAADDSGDPGDCLDWGKISESLDEDGEALESNVALTVGDGVSFEMHILDASCGDVDQCEWSTSRDTLGDALSDCEGNLQSSGSPVCYLPPTSLEDCQAVTQQVSVVCPQSDGSGTVSDDIVFTLRDLSPECVTNASVSGGGCISPQGNSQVAWLLFPLMGLGGLARRRE